MPKMLFAPKIFVFVWAERILIDNIKGIILKAFYMRFCITPNNPQTGMWCDKKRFSICKFGYHLFAKVVDFGCEM